MIPEKSKVDLAKVFHLENLMAFKTLKNTGFLWKHGTPKIGGSPNSVSTLRRSSSSTIALSYTILPLPRTVWGFFPGYFKVDSSWCFPFLVVFLGFSYGFHHFPMVFLGFSHGWLYYHIYHHVFPMTQSGAAGAEGQTCWEAQMEHCHPVG